MGPGAEGRLSEQVARRRGSTCDLLVVRSRVPADLAAAAYAEAMELVLVLVVLGALVAVAVSIIVEQPTWHVPLALLLALEPITRDGLTMWPLTNRAAGGLRTFKIRITSRRRRPPPPSQLP